MDKVSELVSSINSVVWGAPMLVLIVGVGAFLLLRLAFMPLRKLGYGFSLLWAGRVPEGVGDISAFNALMTSLSATIGTGNIAGVATAIAIGGHAECDDGVAQFDCSGDVKPSSNHIDTRVFCQK